LVVRTCKKEFEIRNSEKKLNAKAQRRKEAAEMMSRIDNPKILQDSQDNKDSQDMVAGLSDANSIANKY
jgi:hypothetical protein